MQPSTVSLWRLRLVTLLISALAAASAMYWALKWQNAPVATRTSVAAPEVPGIDSARVAQLLGATPAAASPAAVSLMQASFKLLGVITEGGRRDKGARGSALIAVEGKPAKPYRVGDTVSDGLLLQSVQARSVALGPDASGSASVTLELPPLPGLK